MPVRLPDAGMVDLLEVGDRIDLIATDPQGGGASVVASDVPVLALARGHRRPRQPRRQAGALVVLGVDPSAVTDLPTPASGCSSATPSPLAFECSRQRLRPRGRREGGAMTGFKNFLLRGNLVELAVAFIMALAFAAVVTATVDMLMDLIGKAGGRPTSPPTRPAGSRSARS